MSIFFRSGTDTDDESISIKGAYMTAPITDERLKRVLEWIENPVRRKEFHLTSECCEDFKAMHARMVEAEHRFKLAKECLSQMQNCAMLLEKQVAEIKKDVANLNLYRTPNQ